jgi:hypothetical protein
MSNLKEKILSEMKVDYSDSLDRNFDLAKNFIEITNEGKIHVKIKNNENIEAKDIISLYLIGKIYAKEVELSENENATNEELASELGMPDGTVRTALKRLRDSNKIKQIEPGVHNIPINIIEKTLKEIQERISLNKK